MAARSVSIEIASGVVWTNPHRRHTLVAFAIRLVGRHERDADGGAEEAGAGVGHNSWFRRLYFAFGPRGVDVAL